MKLQLTKFEKIAIGVILAASGIVFIIGPFQHLGMRESWLFRMVCSLSIGVILLWVASRFLKQAFVVPEVLPVSSVGERIPEKIGRLGAALETSVDGFKVFAETSVVVNIFCAIFLRYDLDPTYDALHFIPTFLMNEIWEMLISRSGHSVILFIVAVALFDGIVGFVLGLILYPIRRVTVLATTTRTILFVLFVFYWLACVFLLRFQC